MDSNAVINIVLKILAVLLLVLLNAFFVAAEFALVKIRDSQLEPLIRKGQKSARVARLILERLETFLSAAQLGITLASLGLGWLGEAVFVTLCQPVFGWLQIESPQVQHTLAFFIGFSTITFLHICAGEQAPKLLAIQKPLPTTLWIAYPLFWFYRLSYPFVIILNAASQWLLRQVGLDKISEHEKSYSEEEMRVMLTAAQSTPDRRNLILNALDLRHRTAREVMRPRNEITAFDSDAPIAECLVLAEKTRYSRFPICMNGDLDKTLGIVHVKDLYAQRDRVQTAQDLLPVARKLICVPESARLDRLLQRFLEKKSHFAFVVDEFGGTLGVITLENAIEALVGQIQDEFDSEKLELARQGDNVWEAAGVLPLHELEKIIGQVPHDDSIATVSGWVTEQLGGFPKMGDAFFANEFSLRVEEMDGPRVAKLKITREKIPDGGTTIVRRAPPESK